jgi:hypothetical protein
MQQPVVHRDTFAWIAQTWASFATALFLCIIGIWNAPSDTLDRAFLATGFFFCLSAAFTLAKTIRDNEHSKKDLTAWIGASWAFFFVAAALTAWGLYRMTVSDWQKYFLLGAWLFLVSSTFTLAKTLRDKHEADVAEGRLPFSVEHRSEEEVERS